MKIGIGLDDSVKTGALGSGVGVEYYQRVMSIQPQYLINASPLWDAVGRTAEELSGKTVSVNLVGNGGFETAGAGGSDIWANWTETTGSGAIADEGTIIHGGSHAAKLTAGAGVDTFIRPSNAASTPSTMNVIPGTACTLTFWTRGDGTNAGRYSVYDITHSAYIRTIVTTGVTGTSYTQVTYSFTVPDGCYAINTVLWCAPVNGGVVYYDDASITCDYPTNGVYQPSGITYGQTGIGDGKTAPSFDGSDTAIQLGNIAFGQLWNGNVGSAICWGKVDGASRWTDSSMYRYPWHIKSRQNATVYLVIGKSTGNHQLSWRRRVAGTSFEYLYTFPTTGTLGWFCQGMTWDVISSPAKIKCFLYIPGVLAFTKLYDDTPVAGAETWDNASYTADDGNTTLASGSLSSQEWIGQVAHCYTWAGVALSDTEMRSAMII